MSTTSILFYGNCQMSGYNKIINFKNSNVTCILCWNTTINKTDFTDIINNSDIIITQFINDNYRDTTYLSTKYLLENCKTDCKVIILDNCYFDFYYLDLTYKMFNNTLLETPLAYHYNVMIDYYNNNLSQDTYIENVVNNINFKTYDELEKIAINSINELKNRYETNIERYKIYDLIIHVETCYEYIFDNYKNQLLFYSMNHPTKNLLQHNCDKIIKIIQKYYHIDYDINYDIDPFDCIKCIIYKCIQKNVNFDIDKFIPSINLNLKMSGTNEIINLYYKSYEKINKII